MSRNDYEAFNAMERNPWHYKRNPEQIAHALGLGLLTNAASDFVGVVQ